MKSINPTFNTKQITYFVQDLINDGCTSLDDLTNGDLCDFAGLLIIAAGRNGEQECLVESAHLDQIMAALKRSLHGVKEDNDNLVYIMKENAISYYRDLMESIFENVMQEQNHERDEWIDHVAQYGEPDTLHDSLPF